MQHPLEVLVEVAAFHLEVLAEEGDLKEELVAFLGVLVEVVACPLKGEEVEGQAHYLEEEAAYPLKVVLEELQLEVELAIQVALEDQEVVPTHQEEEAAVLEMEGAAWPLRVELVESMKFLMLKSRTMTLQF